MWKSTVMMLASPQTMTMKSHPPHHLCGHWKTQSHCQQPKINSRLFLICKDPMMELMVKLILTKKTTLMSQWHQKCCMSIIDWCTSLFPGCKQWHVQDYYHMSLPLATNPFVLLASMARLCDTLGG